VRYRDILESKVLMEIIQVIQIGGMSPGDGPALRRFGLSQCLHEANSRMP